MFIEVIALVFITTLDEHFVVAVIQPLLSIFQIINGHAALDFEEASREGYTHLTLCHFEELIRKGRVSLQLHTIGTAKDHICQNQRAIGADNLLAAVRDGSITLVGSGRLGQFVELGHQLAEIARKNGGAIIRRTGLSLLRLAFIHPVAIGTGQVGILYIALIHRIGGTEVRFRDRVNLVLVGVDGTTHAKFEIRVANLQRELDTQRVVLVLNAVARGNAGIQLIDIAHIVHIAEVKGISLCQRLDAAEVEHARGSLLEGVGVETAA